MLLRALVVATETFVDVLVEVEEAVLVVLVILVTVECSGFTARSALDDIVFVGLDNGVVVVVLVVVVPGVAVVVVVVDVVVVGGAVVVVVVVVVVIGGGGFPDWGS